MRLIFPLIIILFGAGIGILINQLFTKSWINISLSALIGGAAAMVGLIIESIFDFNLTQDPLMNSLLMSVGCAAIVSIVTHLVTNGEPPDWAK